MSKRAPRKGEPGYREHIKKKVFNKVVKRIKEDQREGGAGDILFLNDVIAYSGVSTATFYDYFPANSEELEHIKDMIEVERVKRKASLRKKMFQSKNSLGHIALYKLIGTDEERAILNQQDVRLSGSVNTSVTSKQTVVFKTREKKDE